MPSWPSSLPTKVKAGSHNQTPGANAVVFTPEVGEPIRRRRYTGSSASESFVLDGLSYAQKERLMEFWRVDCAQGTSSFYATFVDGIQRKWWFDAQQPPQAQNIRGGNYYTVSLQLGCRR